MAEEKYDVPSHNPVIVSHELSNESGHGVDRKKGTADDRADMWRLGKTQDLTVMSISCVTLSEFSLTW